MVYIYIYIFLSFFVSVLADLPRRKSQAVPAFRQQVDTRDADGVALRRHRAGQAGKGSRAEDGAAALCEQKREGRQSIRVIAGSKSINKRQEGRKGIPAHALTCEPRTVRLGRRH